MDCLLRVGVLGINFKTADLALREEVARATLGLTGEAGLFFAHPTVVLSTCNRTEIYFSAEDLAAAHSDLLQFFRMERLGQFEHRLYSYFGLDCAAHLCRVSAGLDSAIVAETEIQRQVKTAYLAAATRLPSGMHFLFQKALKVGKAVRSTVPLARGSATLPGVLWELIRKTGWEWASARALFVGQSQLNRDLIGFLRKKGMKEFHLCTRHPASIQERGVFGREVLARWEQYDLIVCASKSSSYLVHPKRVDEKRRLIFDLSVPRNVHPDVASLEGVDLYNIEQIDLLVEQGRFALREHLDQAELLVRDQVNRICASYRRNKAILSPLCVLTKN